MVWIEVFHIPFTNKSIYYDSPVIEIPEFERSSFNSRSRDLKCEECGYEMEKEHYAMERERPLKYKEGVDCEIYKKMH